MLAAIKTCEEYEAAFDYEASLLELLEFETEVSYS